MSKSRANALHATRNAPLLDAEAVVKNDGCKDIEEDVRPEDSKVAPALAVVDIRAGQELITDAELAVSAVGRRGRVLQVSRRGAQEGRQVLLTGLAGGRAENRELGLRADDGSVVDLRRHHGCDPVGERRDAVHEDPEAGEGLGGLHDTVEGQREGEDERHDCRGGLCVGHGRDAHDGKGAGVDEKLDAEEQDQDLVLR